MDIKHEPDGEEAKSTLPDDPVTDVDIKREQPYIEEEEEEEDRAPSANGGVHHKKEKEEELQGNGNSHQQHNNNDNDDGDPNSNHHSQDQQAPQINNIDNANGLPSTITNRKSVSQEDIQIVQNLVERCLQLYMPRSEVVDILKAQADIDPSFTGLVWEKLEEQNPDFFKAYYTRLKLKGQIIMFNHLLEQQVSMVQKMQMGIDGGGIFSSSATTASGVGGDGGGGGGDALRHIPLFHGTVDHQHQQQQQQQHHQHQGQVAQDQEVPGPAPQQQTAAQGAQAQAAGGGGGSGGDFRSAFAAHHHHHHHRHHLDGGHSPLSSLPHIESENDLLNMTNHQHHGTTGGTTNTGTGVVPTPGTGGGIHLSQAPGVTPPMTGVGVAGVIAGRGGGRGGGGGGGNDDDGHASGNLDNNNNLAMIPRTFSLSDLGYAEGGHTRS